MPPSQGCCAHNHDCEAASCETSYSLFKNIDLPKVRCLNELAPDSCQRVFRPWAERNTPLENPLRSNDDDPELLLHIPFDGAVKLHAICIVGGQNGTAPASLKAYINRDDIDFTTVADLAPVQEWELQDNSSGFLEYPTQVARFNGVHSLDLYISANFGAEFTEVHFVALKGDFSERQRRAVTAVYEVQPVPGDHKVPGSDQGAHWSVG